MLEELELRDLSEAIADQSYSLLEVERCLPYLPELEAEIFWQLFVRKRRQQDVGDLLALSQKTISYRYGRVMQKLAYLMVVVGLPIMDMARDLTFLSPDDQMVLHDLVYATNQDVVSKQRQVTQSKVRWVLDKSLDTLTKLEQDDPERWRFHLSLVLLLKRNLGIRVRYEGEEGEIARHITKQAT